MSFFPANPFGGQEIQTHVRSIHADLAFLSHYSWANPAAANNNGVLGATALAAGTTTVVTVGIINPVVPRALTVRGNQATAAGDVVIEGTNINDEAIAETIVAAGNADVLGAKAFKTVTKITLPAQGGAGDTISVGWNDKLGLPYRLTANTVLAAALNNVREATAPTVTVSATAIESNTVDLNSALNGTKAEIWLIV